MAVLEWQSSSMLMVGEGMAGCMKAHRLPGAAREAPTLLPSTCWAGGGRSVVAGKALWRCNKALCVYLGPQ
jgi:hypothetical protein